MKNEVIQRIMSVINSLNMVEVKGKANVAAVYGALVVLEETVQKIQTGLQDVPVQVPETDAPTEK